MVRILLLVASATIPTVLLAQTESCVTVAGEVFCPPVSDGTAGSILGEAAFRNEVAAARRAARRAEADRDKLAQEPIALRKAVGIMIADGNCREAYSTALKGGDLELASQTKSLCKDAPHISK